MHHGMSPWHILILFMVAVVLVAGKGHFWGGPRA